MRAATWRRVAAGLTALSLCFVGSAWAQQATEIGVRTTEKSEGAPSRSHGYLAWGTPRAIIVKPDGASKIKIGGTGFETGMGSLDGNKLVYQKFDRNSSSIQIRNLATGRTRKLGGGVNTRHWEYVPKSDLPWVMFGRIIGSKRKLMLVNVKTGTSRVLDTAGYNTYLLPGQVSGDWAVWNVYSKGSKAKIMRHRISTSNTTKIPTGDRHNWGPSVTDEGTAFFGRSNKLCGGQAGLFRAPVGGNITELVRFPTDHDMAMSWAYEAPDGQIEVFHDRSRCATNDSPVDDTDIYKVLDPFLVTLTVAIDTQGNSTGTVTGSGINCGTDCTQLLEPGEEITLTAVPGEGDSFDGWSETACGTELTCTVTVTADMTVTASFGN